MTSLRLLLLMLAQSHVITGDTCDEKCQLETLYQMESGVAADQPPISFLGPWFRHPEFDMGARIFGLVTVFAYAVVLVLALAGEFYNYDYWSRMYQRAEYSGKYPEAVKTAKEIGTGDDKLKKPSYVMTIPSDMQKIHKRRIENIMKETHDKLTKHGKFRRKQRILRQKVQKKVSRNVSIEEFKKEMTAMITGEKKKKKVPEKKPAAKPKDRTTECRIKDDERKIMERSDVISLAKTVDHKSKRSAGQATSQTPSQSTSLTKMNTLKTQKTQKTIRTVAEEMTDVDVSKRRRPPTAREQKTQDLWTNTSQAAKDKEWPNVGEDVGKSKHVKRKRDKLPNVDDMMMVPGMPVRLSKRENAPDPNHRFRKPDKDFHDLALKELENDLVDSIETMTVPKKKKKHRKKKAKKY
uniref:Ribosome biogenesis protein NOP53 n=1 Tax=Caenorhabditis japonica TaxID=281687 RepID=A0A8R1HP86_CAEJA